MSQSQNSSQKSSPQGFSGNFSNAKGMVCAAAEPPQTGLPTGVKRAVEEQVPTALTALIPPWARCPLRSSDCNRSWWRGQRPFSSPWTSSSQLCFLLPGNCPLLAVGPSLTPGSRVSISRSSPCVTDSHSSRCTWFILPHELRFSCAGLRGRGVGRAAGPWATVVAGVVGCCVRVPVTRLPGKLSCSPGIVLN